MQQARCSRMIASGRRQTRTAKNPPDWGGIVTCRVSSNSKNGAGYESNVKSSSGPVNV
jgi:hypothetical protein